MPAADIGDLLKRRFIEAGENDLSLLILLVADHLARWAQLGNGFALWRAKANGIDEDVLCGRFFSGSQWISLLIFAVGHENEHFLAG